MTIAFVNLIVVVALVAKCRRDRQAKRLRKERKQQESSNGHHHNGRVEGGTINKSFHSLSSKFGPPLSSCDDLDSDTLTTASSITSLPDA